MRFVAAIVTSLSMLHLLLVGGDLACASHGAGGTSAAMAMAMGSPTDTHGGSRMASAAASDVASRAQATAPAEKDCATPSQQHCCEATSSCGVTTIVGGIERFVAPPVVGDGTPSHVSGVLVSVLTAPDPPPPKA